MASEATRKIKRKRVKLPGSSTVDVPVITQIAFIDASDRGQETQYTIDNTKDADRTVHIATIPGGGSPTDESGGGGGNNLRVERIDKFKLFDASDRGQETFPEPDSKTIQQPPDAPPYFTTHAKTHIVKYVKRKDDDTEDTATWIKSELIDQINFLDASDRGWETQYSLTNPSQQNQSFDGLRFGTDEDGKVTVSVDSSIEEITDYNGDPDPVRTDPFQNIVDFSETVVGIFWLYEPHYTGTTQPPALAVGQSALAFTLHPGDPHPPDLTHTWVIGGTPALSPSTLTFTDDPKTWVWTYKTGTQFLFNQGTSSASLSIPFKGLSDFTDPNSLGDEGSISCSFSGATLSRDSVPWTLYLTRISINTLEPTNPYGSSRTGGPVPPGITFEAWFKPP